MGKDMSFACYFFTQGWNQGDFGQYYLYDNLLDSSTGITDDTLLTLAVVGGLGGGYRPQYAPAFGHYYPPPPEPEPETEPEPEPEHVPEPLPLYRRRRSSDVPSSSRKRRQATTEATSEKPSSSRRRRQAPTKATSEKPSSAENSSRRRRETCCDLNGSDVCEIDQVLCDD